MKRVNVNGTNVPASRHAALAALCLFVVLCSAGEARAARLLDKVEAGGNVMVVVVSWYSRIRTLASTRSGVVWPSLGLPQKDLSSRPSPAGRCGWHHRFRPRRNCLI